MRCHPELALTCFLFRREHATINHTSYNLGNLFCLDSPFFNRLLSEGGESATSAVAGVTACQPPGVPTGLTATLNGAQAILIWNPVPGATSYTVARATAGTPYTAIATGLAGTTYTDTKWTAGYYYAVAASNDCSQSGYSSYVFGSTNVTISIRQSGTNVILAWPLGTLQSAPRLTGPFSNVPGATSFYTNPATATAQFYRVLVP